MSVCAVSLEGPTAAALLLRWCRCRCVRKLQADRLPAQLPIQSTLHRPACLPALAPACLPADDDNDLQLAHLVGKAYLPGITAESVAQAVAEAPERFHVARQRGVFATEEVLRLLVAQQMGG